jgi:5-(carboxyamino)imidazole ribonucleotide synthase
MFNILGTVPDPSTMLETPNAKLHLYGKEAKPGRKLGHLTLLNPSQAEEDGVASLFR